MSLITIFPIPYPACRQKRQKSRFFDGVDQFPLVFRRNACYAPGDDLPAVIEVFLQQPDVLVINDRVGRKVVPHQRRPESFFRISVPAILTFIAIFAL